MRDKLLMGIGGAICLFYFGKKYKDQIKKISNRFPDSLTKFNKMQEFNK